MAGEREKIVAVGITIQPTPGTFNPPAAPDDLIAVSTPDDGSDAVTGEDPTLTGTIWDPVPVFLGRKGRAGATAPLRGPGALPAANDWVIGRVLQAVGFTENRLASDITGTAQAGGSTTSIQLAAGASAVDDFYVGMPIQHANLGTGFRQTSLIRAYDGTTKIATLAEVVTAITSGSYTIPSGLTYLLGTGASVPLLSASVWRHNRRRDYRDCAVSSFAINIPVANEANTDLPSIEFGLVGVPEPGADETAPPLPTSLLTPIPPARAGKFVFNGVKVGHQSMRIEFGLETGAPPNQNFDAGQESYEILSGSRNLTIDLNQTLLSVLDIDPLVDAQTAVPIMETHGLSTLNRFGLITRNAYLNPFNPQPRAGFVGLQGSAAPVDTDKAIALAVW